MAPLWPSLAWRSARAKPSELAYGKAGTHRMTMYPEAAIIVHDGRFLFYGLCRSSAVSLFADSLESGKFREFSGKKGFS
ncbi:hypothetical protein MCC01970_15360 [Bifidobacteriaceae bacterium MCC01970]|nr:hypothetical protein MCC01970_15360 [Bifidobacteriaceae bacterium MCC01970]